MNTKQLPDDSSSWKKKIVLFLLSQNVSLFGSSVVGFAIIWHITLQTSSGKWLMLFTVCALLPQVLISLWAGVWADRYNRKHLIMLAMALSPWPPGLAVVFLLGHERLELLVVSFLHPLCRYSNPGCRCCFRRSNQRISDQGAGINQTFIQF